jgi:apolipoprotein N-acyltransferase
MMPVSLRKVVAALNPPHSLPWREFAFWLLCGAAAILGFAPFGWWPVQIISLALLFYRTLQQGNAPLAQHAWRGFAYGLGWTVCGMYWLYITMHHYGHMAAWLSALAVLVLGITYLAPFAALALWSACWLRRRWQLGPVASGLLVLPATWALTEWMRGWLLTGLPWVVSGYAHSDSPLAGFAPLVGVYGIGALVALWAAALALLKSPHSPNAPNAPNSPDSPNSQDSLPPTPQFAPRWRLHPGALALLIMLPATGSLLHRLEWATPHGKPISVRLLQGNVSQEAKFDRNRLDYSFQLYRQLILSAPADLIATPETGLPTFIHQLPPDYLLDLQRYAQTNHSHLALGLLVADGPAQYANSMVGISPNPEKSLYRYDKTHLVPFGEFVPFGFRWFVDLLGIPMPDQTPGRPWQKPWQVADQAVLPNICYEDLFGEEIAHQMAQSHAAGEPVANILLNMSNLAWFDDSLALPQHLQIARMRVLELARPMLRATNTGVTAIIEPGGRVVAQLPYLQQGELRTTVQGFQGMTPYARFGNRILLLLAGLALLVAWWLGKRAALVRAGT